MYPSYSPSRSRRSYMRDEDELSSNWYLLVAGFIVLILVIIGIVFLVPSKNPRKSAVDKDKVKDKDKDKVNDKNKEEEAMRKKGNDDQEGNQGQRRPVHKRQPEKPYGCRFITGTGNCLRDLTHCEYCCHASHSRSKSTLVECLDNCKGYVNRQDCEKLCEKEFGDGQSDARIRGCIVGCRQDFDCGS